MKELVFATHNAHKALEIQALTEHYKIKCLSDIGYVADIEENADTLEGNALLKARTIASAIEGNCFADDTGLEVSCLGNRPGVYSARYVGEGGDPKANIAKLLAEMQGQKNRQARFRTVIALILGGKEYLFEGVVNGHITHSPAGESGFGYDPVFMPEGETRTFAQMPLAEKNSISHRALATQKLLEFLALQPS